MHSYHLNVFELEVSFKTEADPTRVENACAYVENLYRDLKLHGNHLGRDRLLTILILGIADDLLQLKQQGVDVETRLNALVQRIEKHDTPPESRISIMEPPSSAG
ncbi:MAG TPA: cell division protein ZapA [Candidatus Mailhella merdigallinarum]|uniref:Cell division protein ZapA n=1 Tax=Candidatus Mailhella merdigallinarum TaxID=2838658 RepID=A0A9D2HD79_9BACT|nr:cell division protein ZapA [Desulfovibrionaceae bacterium]PWM71318.1 MAG: cell division protein ZapA [Desulfovibrionaceae bacterium]HJA08021.1 cell division protein ZapA [Candidatus Mailhella merdigallinarum]